MVKLNGWKRLGIIASFAWIIGAGLYALNSASNRDINYASSTSLRCESAQSPSLTPEQNDQILHSCDQASSDYLKKAYPYEWMEAAIVAFVPVPFGWAFAHLLFFLVRWVKRGFMSSR